MADMHTMIFNAVCLGILIGAALSLASTIWYRNAARIIIFVLSAVSLIGGMLALYWPVFTFGLSLAVGWFGEQAVRLIRRKRTGC